MRKARIKFRGERAVYHCISRVVGGQFLLESREKEVLRKQLWQVASFCGVEILTYCLMGNHFHVLVRTPDASQASRIGDKELRRRVKLLYSDEKAESILLNLRSEDGQVRDSQRRLLLARMGDVSLFMKELKQRFSIWYNKTHKRFGTLWAERFKSVLVEDDPLALSTVAAYIDLNPVRAGLVNDPALYRFCGYGESMSGSRRARQGIASLWDGGRGFAVAVRSYRVVLFGKGELAGASPRSCQVDPDRAAKIIAEGGRLSLQEALRCRVRYLSDGAVLGSARFVQRYFDTHRNAFGPRRRDGPRRMKGADWNELTCIRDLRARVIG